MKQFVVFLLGALAGAAVVYFVCCKVDLAEGIMEPKGLISPEQAKTLDQAFNTRHQLISDSIVKRPDNRSSWYSLTDMRNYLDYAENQAKDLGYTMNGIRVYMGAHSDTANEKGYSTLFFVPTGSENFNEASMFNISFQGTGDIKGGFGLNGGDPGHPPQAKYPQ